ncbi:MAG: glycosyltransferase family 2 protein [Candidatus Omnitrophota bacterium]
MLYPYSLSIVIPVFNEEENIAPLLKAINRTVPSICADYEIILVDDASTDSSGEMLDAVAGTDRRVKVLHHERNRTLGGSLRTGFNAATKDLILYFDADLPFDLKEIAKAIAMLDAEDADYFSAYRTSRGGEGVRRFFYSYIYNGLIELLFRLGVKDVNFSFKLFKRSFLNEIRLSSEGSFINVEMLARVRMSGRKIVQFPCDYHPRTRGRSTLSSFKVIVKILDELTRFFFWRREKQEMRT